ncbi:NAD-dependent epimerase/dehydratase family protein [Flavobacteriaceae bacterium]|nr:NAD-dependent epimerase/dehydratase family protein [Flavobacteriaceae bacterium]|tara:strand:- start:3705 stop:4550 length:846 start_codon:yes stop_codon:yes gene_type:complete
MKVLLTGSSGFIGSNLSTFLNDKNIEIFKVSKSEGYDLLDWSKIQNLPKCDIIIHLAAYTFVPDSFENPRDYYYNNITITLNILELARSWNAKVIYMSSYCYGPPKYIPVDENHSINPHNPYSQTKWISEELCSAYSRDFGLSVIAFRLFNVYGPNQKGSFLIPEILNNIKHNNKVKLKDPRPKRDFIHVNDVVLAIYKSLEIDFKGFNEFNLGTGRSISVKELVNAIKDINKLDFKIEFTNEYRKGEVLDSVADISKLRKYFSWSPSISFEKGVLTLFDN